MRSALFLAFMCVAYATGQSTISVDLLDPGDEGFAGIPAYRRCVDVFVDIDPADAWTVGGIRATAHHGATLEYYDSDPNIIIEVPFILNPGVEHKFETSLSRPRLRDANARFTNAGAAAIGASDRSPNYIFRNWTKFTC